MHTPSSDPQFFNAGANLAPTYEVGTWLPEITFDTPGNLIVKYSFRVATFTRMGNIAFATIGLITSIFTHTTASGLFKITGFPFTFAFNDEFGYIAPVAFEGIALPDYTNFNLVPSNVENAIFMVASASGKLLVNVTASNFPTGTTKAISSTFVAAVE